MSPVLLSVAVTLDEQTESAVTAPVAWLSMMSHTPLPPSNRHYAIGNNFAPYVG
jgi:hypothetical protein